MLVMQLGIKPSLYTLCAAFHTGTSLETGEAAGAGSAALGEIPLVPMERCLGGGWGEVAAGDYRECKSWVLVLSPHVQQAVWLTFMYCSSAMKGPEKYG